MSNIVSFPFDKIKKCDYCESLGGDEIQGIGINKIVPNPLKEKLGYWVENICLDCLDCMKDYEMED